MNLQKSLWISKNILKCNLHTTAALNKIKAGRYKITRDRSKPLNYEQSFWPDDIANKKGKLHKTIWSINTGPQSPTHHYGLAARAVPLFEPIFI